MQNLFRKLKRDIDKAAFVSCINMVATIKKKKKLFLLIFLDVQLEKVEKKILSAPLMTIIQSISLYEMLLT